MMSAAVPGLLHHAPLWTTCGNTGWGTTRAIELKETTRHVVVAGNESQRSISACMHPVGCLDGVAGRIASPVAGIDAGLDRLLRRTDEPQEIADGHSRVHTGNERPLRLVRRKELETGGDSFAAAGQNHNSVGGGDRIGHLFRNIISKPNEADRPQAGGSESSRHNETEAARPLPSSGSGGVAAARTHFLMRLVAYIDGCHYAPAGRGRDSPTPNADPHELPPFHCPFHAKSPIVFRLSALPFPAATTRLCGMPWAHSSPFLLLRDTEILRQIVRMSTSSCHCRSGRRRPCTTRVPVRNPPRLASARRKVL